MNLPINIAGLIFGLLIFLIGGLAIILLSTRKGGFFNKYPIRVTIIEERAGNKVVDFDFARRIKEEGQGIVLELKNRKKQLPPIPLNFLIIDKKGNSNLYLYTADNEKFFPIRIQTSGEDASFLEEKSWDIVDYRTAIKLKELYHTPSFLERYGNILYLIIFGFMLMVVMYVVFGKLGDIVNISKTSLEIASKNLEATKELNKALIQALGKIGLNVTSVTPTQPPY